MMTNNRFRAKYAGVCRDCGLPFGVGVWIFRDLTGPGYVHSVCPYTGPERVRFGDAGAAPNKTAMAWDAEQLESDLLNGIGS